jgi:serine/threonine-protein kinase 24/25/MST4
MHSNPNYKVIEHIGSGSYGNVYKALHIPSDTVVAVKEIVIDHGHSNVNKILLMLSREIEIL